MKHALSCLLSLMLFSGALSALADEDPSGAQPADSISETESQAPEGRRPETEEERQAARERWESMSDDEREAAREQARERWESMSEEEREAARSERGSRGDGSRRERFESLSQEERQAARERMRSRRNTDGRRGSGPN